MENKKNKNIIYLRDVGEIENKAIELCKKEHNISVTTRAVKQIFEDYLKLKIEVEALKKKVYTLEDEKRKNASKMRVIQEFSSLLKQAGEEV